MESDKTKQDEPSPKIMAVYGLMVLSVLVCFIPHLAFAYLSMFLFVATLLTAYIFRAEDNNKNGEDGLQANHMTWIIRTIWIVSLLAIPTVGVAAAYMIPQIDYSIMDHCVQNVASQLDPENPDYAAMDDLIQPCMDDFLHHNKIVFFIALIIGGGPLTLYFIIRLYRGITAARAGVRIENVKRWF